MKTKYVVKGNGWFVPFRSEKDADKYCIHVRRKYGNMVYVEKLALALALAAALATPGFGAEDHSADDQMGVGLTVCTDFLKMAQKAPINEMIFYSWAQGFISAANRSRLMQGADSVNVSAISQTEQQKRLRDYCRAHPLTEYMFAVADLINHLPTNPGSAAAEQTESK